MVFLLPILLPYNHFPNRNHDNLNDNLKLRQILSHYCFSQGSPAPLHSRHAPSQPGPLSISPPYPDALRSTHCYVTLFLIYHGIIIVHGRTLHPKMHAPQELGACLVCQSLSNHESDLNHCACSVISMGRWTDVISPCHVPYHFQKKWLVWRIETWFPIRHPTGLQWSQQTGREASEARLLTQMFVHPEFSFEWTTNHVILARKLHSASGFQPSKYLLAQWNETKTLFAETYSCFILQRHSK